MFALQGNHPQAAVECTVKSPHLFLGVYELFCLFCPSSAETPSTTIKLFLILALCLLLFGSAKTQMLMYVTTLYSLFYVKENWKNHLQYKEGSVFPPYKVMSDLPRFLSLQA